jgi:hypothetical protein
MPLPKSVLRKVHYLLVYLHFVVNVYLRVKKLGQIDFGTGRNWLWYFFFLISTVFPLKIDPSKILKMVPPT